MARNSELVRQWEILRDIDGARTGIPIARLAALRRRPPAHHPAGPRRAGAGGVSRCSTRRSTARRCGSCRANPFRGLERLGLSTMELCALYLGRTMLAAGGAAAVGGRNGPRLREARRRALPEPARKFLDRLPMMIKSKVTGRRKQDARKAREILARITDASLLRRRVEMTYHSRLVAPHQERTSSNRCA